jgi:hypothetical protein
VSRRVVGVTLAGTSVLLGLQPSHAATTAPSPLLPIATCASRLVDAPGDGVATFNPVDVNNVPAIADPRGNVGGLDITGITFRVTATRVYAFMSLADIPDTFRPTDSAYGYVLWFKRNGKIARFDQVYANQTLATQGLAPASGFPTASVGTTTAGGEAMTGVGGGVDPAKNVAYVYADRAAVETKMGGPLEDGEELTAVSGRTELWETDGKTAPGVARRPADTTDLAAAAAVWAVGDERCFPQPTVTVPAVSVQYGDAATLTATLKDDAGTPLPDRTVAVTVPGESAPRTLTTDATGTVQVALATTPAAGTYDVAVTFAGDDATGRGAGTGTLTVRAETVRIAPLAVRKAGTARTVTATLTEDDPRAFAKQPVVWYVNGKKAATGTTDAAGRSVFTGAKAGQKVQARYAGVTGRYAAVVSNTVTV